MARKPRIEIAGGIYHLIARGNNRQRIFRSHDDLLKFLGLLERQKSKLPFYLYAYCLMLTVFVPTHCKSKAQTPRKPQRLGLAVDARESRQCAEVLFDLGLCKVKVISNNPGKLRALEEAGLEIVERVSIEVSPSESATKYLRTKKEKLGHLLEFGD